MIWSIITWKKKRSSMLLSWTQKKERERKRVMEGHVQVSGTLADDDLDKKTRVLRSCSKHIIGNVFSINITFALSNFNNDIAEPREMLGVIESILGVTQVPDLSFMLNDILLLQNEAYITLKSSLSTSSGLALLSPIYRYIYDIKESNVNKPPTQATMTFFLCNAHRSFDITVTSLEIKWVKAICIKASCYRSSAVSRLRTIIIGEPMNFKKARNFLLFFNNRCKSSLF